MYKFLFLVLLLVAVAAATVSPLEEDGVDALERMVDGCPDKCRRGRGRARRQCRRSGRRRRRCTVVRCTKKNGKRGFKCTAKMTGTPEP